jgi:transglutaminase-like putative cysteine protease
MTNALAALGVLALVSSGQFSMGVNIAILVGLVGALAIREEWQRHPSFRHIDTIALLVVIGIQVTRYALGVSGLDVLVEFAAALQLVRLATRRGAVHDQQVIVLALLHLIAGTVLGGGIAYGICFAGVLLVAPGALVLSHLRREVEGNYRQGARDRTGLPVDVPRILRSRRVVGRTFLATMCLLSIPIFLFTIALFVFFPRVGLSLLLLNRNTPAKSMGFSPRIDLGSVGAMQEDRTLVLRVKPPITGAEPPEHLTLHLRGTALDHYDGRAWSQTERDRKQDVGGGYVFPVETSRMPNRDAPVMEMVLEPIDPPVLFFPPNTVAMKLHAPDVMLPSQQIYSVRGPEGEFRYHAPDERGMRYDVYLGDQPSFSKLDVSDRDRYLQLPEVSDRTRELARGWTANAKTDLERAKAIEAHLQTDFVYELPSGEPPRTELPPLEHFLHESKKGHCEFYSTAMAVMLRTQGIPTRNITGFAGGQYNRFGEFYAVRQKDAHSWVEAYIEGAGWVTFDPTPPASVTPPSGLSGTFLVLTELLEASAQHWDRHVVGYDLEQQYGLIRKVNQEKAGSSRSMLGRRTIVILVGGGVILFAAFQLLRRRSPPKGERNEEPTAWSKSMVRATAIYEGLENALAVQGVHRSPGMPPLRHAENLASAAHPLGKEVLDITQVYLSVRFGGMTLTDDVAADLERRVKLLRGRDLKKELREQARAS